MVIYEITDLSKMPSAMTKNRSYQNQIKVGNNLTHKYTDCTQYNHTSGQLLKIGLKVRGRLFDINEVVSLRFVRILCVSTTQTLVFLM